MTFGFLILAFAAVTNPARAGLALRDTGDRGIGYGPLFAGVALVFGASALLAAFADTLLGGLRVSPETFALSAAAVMAVMAARTALFPRFRNLPRLGGLHAGLIPVAIPILFTPELFMLTVTAASLESAGETLGAVAIALVLVWLGVLACRRAPSDVAVGMVARLIAVGGMVVAVTIAFHAIYNV